VLAGDGGGRAAMTASWLAQMGWEVAVLEADGAGPRAWADTGQARMGWGPARTSWGPARTGSGSRRDRGRRPGRPRRSQRRQNRPRWKAGCGMAGQRSSTWIPAAGSKPGTCPARPGPCGPTSASPGLADRLGRPDRLVLTSADGMLARFAAADVPAGTEVLVLAGGTTGWARSGRPLETARPPCCPPVIDVYRRPYEGTGVDPDAMQAYLDWEYGLVGQLERDGTHGFRVLR